MSFAPLKRRFKPLLLKALLGFTAFSAVGLLQAADWPSRPLRLIVPYPPGGGADMVGRYYADKLATALNQPVVVENKPGAGTTIAGAAAARSAADGYTISLATVEQLTIAPHLYPNVGYEPLKDFAPIATLAATPIVVAAGGKRRIERFEDLVTLAKTEPGKLSFSSCSAASLCHLAGELVQQRLGLQLLHVPYKGSAPAIQGLLSADVDTAFDTQLILAPQIKAGKAKGLVILSSQRSTYLPDVPSADEVGLKGLDVQGWYGFVVPTGTPQAIVDRLTDETARIAALPATRERMNGGGLTVFHTQGADYKALIARDYDTWQTIIRQTGIRIE